MARPLLRPRRQRSANARQTPSTTSPAVTTSALPDPLLPSTSTSAPQGSSSPLSETNSQDDVDLTDNSQGDWSDNNSDHSQYPSTPEAISKKRKVTDALDVTIGPKKVFRYRKSYGSAPEKSPLRDDPFDRLSTLPTADDTAPWTLANAVSSEHSTSAFANTEQNPSQTLTFSVTGSNGQKAVVAVNLNQLINNPAVAAMISLPPQSAAAPGGESGPIVAATADTASVATSDTAETEQKKVGFLDLPLEIRDRIYRKVMVDDEPIDFYTRENLSHSSALLRTCKTVHDEATDILYGANTFHFKRQSEYRGKYFEQRWYEVGYEDVRRFFEAIGQVNISKMNYISLQLTDGLENPEPGMVTPDNQVKFVTDPNLQHVFNLIGKNTVLERFGVIFSGRTQVTLAQFHFLKALSTIKCYEIDLLSRMRNMDFLTSRIRVSDIVHDRLKEIMVVARPDTDRVDQTKKKVRVKLAYSPSRSTAWETLASLGVV